MFAREADNDPTILASLENALLYKVDCEKGEGIELAKRYEVRGYPTFIMVDAEGRITDRWLGYDGPDAWAANVELGKADRRTIVAKQAAYAAAPTPELARSLANDAAGGYDFQKAVGYLRTGRDLDPDGPDLYSEPILTYLYYGADDFPTPFSEVEAEARRVLGADGTTADDWISVAQIVVALARSTDAGEQAVPIIREALQRTADLTDEDLAPGRNDLQIELALLGDKDPAKALELKRAAMPEGWQEETRRLHQFAWWCLDNGINLEEADELILKAIGLSADDAERARLLSTAAEIGNARGDGAEAVARIKRAIELSPERERFKTQLAEFEKALAEKDQG